MTQSFTEAAPAGYCPRCRQGYAVGPHVCPVKERPILFSGPMVRAILEGRKTQTRRALRQQPLDILPMQGEKLGREWVILEQREPEPKGKVVRCRFGVSGDRLWVKETFALYDGDQVEYRASPICGGDPDRGWKPSIFMPRKLSRITLEVKDVRVERLQEITSEDAEAEGVQCDLSAWGFVDHFRELWKKINGAESWSANPWVWVVTFERVK